MLKQDEIINMNILLIVNQNVLSDFNPHTSTLVINTNHEFVREHYDEAVNNPLLEDIVTAEALLEVYLREHGVPAGIIGEILERRDLLLRSLAKDHPYSLKSLGQSLRDAAADQHDLEVALIAAARGLGFVAKHISGSGKPDGIAKFFDYPHGEKIIILEAKSSQEVPNLGALDMAGLQEHMIDYFKNDGYPQAHGCLLLAPAYPGSKRENNSAVAKRAKNLHISCWTIEQFASFIEVADEKHLNAKDVLQIVLNHYTPSDVSGEIEKLLESREHTGLNIYRAILEDLRRLEGKQKEKVRTLDFLHGRLINEPGFEELQEDQLKKAIQELAGASKGGIRLISQDKIFLDASIDEIERRVAGLTKNHGVPRRPSRFRDKD